MSLELLAPAVSMEVKLPPDLTTQRQRFLNDIYMSDEYLITPELRDEMTETSRVLLERHPPFALLTLVGGMVNGSNRLRVMESDGKHRPSSDLDFYLGGYDVSQAELTTMAHFVQDSARRLGLGIDGALDGTSKAFYLNLDRIEEHISDGYFDLLALPFQCSFGKVSEAKLKVLEAVIKHPDKEILWTHIANAHIQSLSLHHGSWSLGFSNYVMDEFYTKKIDKFQLPDTPETAMATCKAG